MRLEVHELDAGDSDDLKNLVTHDSVILRASVVM